MCVLIVCIYPACIKHNMDMYRHMHVAPCVTSTCTYEGSKQMDTSISSWVQLHIFFSLDYLYHVCLVHTKSHFLATPAQLEIYK